jgi:CubicO group peptidase (beta-lactamase class C family)
MNRTALYILSLLCASLLFASCEQDRDFSPTFPSRAILGSGPYGGPYWPTEDWRSCSPEEVGMDSDLLRKMNEDMVLQMKLHIDVHSVIVIRKGYIVAEQYYTDDFSSDSLHYVFSCTKSITSLLLGITLERHKKLNVDEPVFNFFPQYDSLKTPEKEQITLKHVLTMTSGLSEDDDFEKHNPDDLVKHMINQPLESTPGEKFKYNNNGANLLGSIINTLEKKQADEFAKEVLFNKLGISEFYWEKEDGVLLCHSDLHLYPIDMAKIGLLVLNNGYWNGEQIVPKEWIVKSTKPHVPESEFFDYGYQWWYRSKQNKSWWRDPVQGSKNEHDMFLAMGYGGQYIMVIRDLNMVIVTTSSDYNEDNGMGHQKVPMVIEEIIPAITNTR